MVDLSSFSVFAEDRPDNGDKTEVVPVLDLSMDPPQLEEFEL